MLQCSMYITMLWCANNKTYSCQRDGILDLKSNQKNKLDSYQNLKRLLENGFES